MLRNDVKTYIGQVFDLDALRLEAIMSVIDNAHVEQRYSIFPVDYIIRPRPLSQISREYREHSLRLGRQVAADAIERAGLKPTDIDLLITVSCTGVMIPSLDAHLILTQGVLWLADHRRLARRIVFALRFTPRLLSHMIGVAGGMRNLLGGPLTFPQCPWNHSAKHSLAAAIYEKSDEKTLDDASVQHGSARNSGRSPTAEVLD